MTMTTMTIKMTDDKLMMIVLTKKIPLLNLFSTIYSSSLQNNCFGCRPEKRQHRLNLSSLLSKWLSVQDIPTVRENVCMPQAQLTADDIIVKR